jgi:asparagine synthase (glutamine-hydrolysing)
MLDLMTTLQNLYPTDGPVRRPSRIRLTLTNDPVVRIPGLAGRAFYRNYIRPLDARMRPSIRSSNVESWLLPHTPIGRHEMDAAEESAIDSLGPLNAHLYRDFHQTVLPTILRNFDRCSMAHGIEVRMPFMDWRLVCFVFSLPEQSKIGGGFTKRILREAMRGTMPEELRTRKNKIGFNSPLPEWFNGPLKPWVLDLVNQPDFLQSELWNGETIREFVQARFQQGQWTWAECQRVWPFLHAQVWRQVFLKKGNRSMTNHYPMGAEAQDI